MVPMLAEPHSKQFLTDERDRWWSDVQVRQIAARLGLSSVRDAVDVGCGQGHWTRVVAGVLPDAASLVGVDREPAWIELARARGGARLRYTVGTAEQLPFADGTVDLVTAQTLLIHVREPRVVLAEMARVLRSGGRLWLVEPNNLVSSISMFADPATDLDDVVDAFRLELVCQRGKHALGLGYNSLGEKLVGLLDPAAWRDITVELCDRVPFIAPPYPDGFVDGVRAALHGEPIVTWPRDETLRYFIAGGGEPAVFDRLWRASLALLRKRAETILAGEYAAAEGVLLYAITATKA